MKFWAFLATLLLAATAAKAQRVTYDYIEGTDFSGYESFAWRDRERSSPNPIAAKRITASLEERFRADGYRLSTGEDADFLVDFDATLSESLRIDEVWWGRGRRRGWVRDIEVTTYPVGTLAVIVLDGASGEVVWRGVVSGALTENREKIGKRIDKAVGKLLKKFPPPQ